MCFNQIDALISDDFELPASAVMSSIFWYTTVCAHGVLVCTPSVWPAMCTIPLCVTIEDVGSVVRIRVMVDMQRQAVSIMVGCAASASCGRPRSRREVASSAV